MNPFILDFQSVDRSKLHLVGGKGANLGELSRMEGIHVPPGFCISTEAFKMIVNKPSISILLDGLSQLKLDDRSQLAKLSSQIRLAIEEVPIPEYLHKNITGYLDRLGEDQAYAVRSSATAEDLPVASFAGQQDTYLNIIGKKAILRHISKCWASLFTERAIAYRLQNDLDHRKVLMSVVVQKMVFSQAAGVMFTADPLTSNRKILSIDASFGLGEALASGLVNADTYKVRNGHVVNKKIAIKELAIYASRSGGTRQQLIDPELQVRQTLTDDQILQLEKIGRKIENYFCYPQDIEWCWADNMFYIVQSRPITTLFPIPEADDKNDHVYISVGHQQMMTDPIKPLGLSFFLLTTKAPMRTAGGRLFVDVTPMIASPESRENLLDVMGKSDPLMKDALSSLLEREDFIKSLPENKNGPNSGNTNKGPAPLNFKTLNEYDTSVVHDLVTSSQASIEALRENIQKKAGPDLFDFIMSDIRQLKDELSKPESFGVIMSAMNASSWLNEKMLEWLGERNVADTISQSAPDNITSEMGLALLDLADVIRPYPQVTEYLQQVKEDDFLADLGRFDGGLKVQRAFHAFLNKYGMRCAGEIDITKDRWSEKPVILIPLILGNLTRKNVGAGRKQFDHGRKEALDKEKELLNRLKHLPDGDQKVKQTKRMIDIVRNFIGYREYPKYAIISRYFLYKKALLKEAQTLVQQGSLNVKEDVYYLSFDEFKEVVRTGKLDDGVISKRKSEYLLFEKLTPPRVITSEGEIVTGEYKRKDLPANALVGLPVSSGVVEGRARVIFNMETADLEEGDILVTSFTDPGWTAVFISIKGLVTEVGGLMTHGAVIAREYGLPAVVGVENATRLIKDKQRIRVNGTMGYVEII